jgi:hypothetical protein
MGSGAMIRNKDWFRHSKVDKGKFAYTQKAWSSHKPISIFQNKENRLKRPKTEYKN